MYPGLKTVYKYLIYLTICQIVRKRSTYRADTILLKMNRLASKR